MQRPFSSMVFYVKERGFNCVLTLHSLFYDKSSSLMITSMWIDLAKMRWGEVTPSLIIFYKFSEGSGLEKISLYRGKKQRWNVGKTSCKKGGSDRQSKLGSRERNKGRFQCAACKSRKQQTETENQALYLCVERSLETVFLTRTWRMASKLCLYTCSRDRDCMCTLHLILYFCCAVS